MRQQINSQLYRMLIVLSAIAGLALWNHEFVRIGIGSHLLLNLTIIAVFVYGVTLAFRDVLLLRNEENAFNSLKETYDDIQQDGERGATDPYWRHHRCLQPAIVVERPRILGHVYDLVYEELMRTRRLRLSSATMQQLMNGISSRLADERALLQNVTGILIILGLIGAFIGLVNMVGSVSDILGGLSGSRIGRAGDFHALMAQLQQPLKGMATGFSSSLFGLFTSLSLGLIARFSNTASLAFKDSFESWLASVSQDEARDAHVNAAPASAEALAAGSMSGISQSFERLHRDIASSSTESAEFIKGQMRQTGYLQRGVRHLQSLVDGQINLDRKLAGTLNRMTDALCQFEEHGRMHNQTLIEHNAQTAERLENAINRLVASLDAIAASQNRGEEARGNEIKGLEETMRESLHTMKSTVATVARAQQATPEPCEYSVPEGHAGAPGSGKPAAGKPGAAAVAREGA